MNDELEEGLETLIHEYNLDYFHIGDNVELPDLGECSVYLPVDIRPNHEKCKENFNDYFFRRLDGKTIGRVQFNSVLLTQKEIEWIGNGFKINWDAPNLLKQKVEKGFLYEIMAINVPFARDDYNFRSNLSELRDFN